MRTGLLLSALAALLTGCPRDVNCAKLSLDDCAAQPGCSLITGRRVLDETGQCVLLDRSEPIRCTSSERDSCGFFTEFASPGDGSCYQIGNACVPRDWQSCGESYDTGDICR